MIVNYEIGTLLLANRLSKPGIWVELLFVERDVPLKPLKRLGIATVFGTAGRIADMADCSPATVLGHQAFELAAVRKSKHFADRSHILVSVDQLIALRIEEAWKNPQITAAEMVNLYAQLSRGNSVQSQMIGVYPPNFDFRAFLDGLRALKVKDSQSPSAMPGDTLRQWAAIDPQGAAEWLLEAQTSPQGGWTSRIPFADWEHIADAVSAKNGPQAYYQWAAQILAQSPEEWGKIIITESKDGELAGIVACITDTALRDRLLVENAGARHWSAGSMTDRLAMISTPELRLRAIANNPHQFRSWAKTAGRDAGMWERLGLTYEQVAEVLPEERSRR